MTSPADTIREALTALNAYGLGEDMDEVRAQELAKDAAAALTELEQQLAAPCRCDKCRDCVAANRYEAAEADRDRLAAALREAEYDRDHARAALDRHTVDVPEYHAEGLDERGIYGGAGHDPLADRHTKADA